MSNLRRPDVLAASGKYSSKQRRSEGDIDEGIEMESDKSSVSEGEGESLDEEEEEQDVGQTVAKTASGQVKGTRGRHERVMSPAEVRAHLRLLFDKEPRICRLIYGRHGNPAALSSVAPPPLADMFFMEVVPVTPTRFRPAARMGDELFENSQNSLLTAVLSTCQRIQKLNQDLINQAKAERGEHVLDAVAKAQGGRTFELLLEALIKLQHDVNSFVDSTKNPAVMRQGKLPPPGVKQLLEKKEGLFRKHMMVSDSTCFK